MITITVNENGKELATLDLTDETLIVAGVDGKTFLDTLSDLAAAHYRRAVLDAEDSTLQEEKIIVLQAKSAEFDSKFRPAKGPSIAEPD